MLDTKYGYIPHFGAMDISEIIRRAGGASKVAKHLGRHHSSVLGWARVPPQHVRAIAGLSGVAPEVIRPDIFGEPTDHHTAAPQPEAAA